MMRGNLRARQLPCRLLVAGYDVLGKMKAELPKMVTDGVIPDSVRPLAQAADLFNVFVSGGDFSPPLPHQMRPLGHGVWRLRTPDLRIDGWFPDRNFFVIGAFDSKANCEANKGRDNAMVAEVIDLRTKTNLLGGTYMEAEDYHDLIRL